MDTLPMIQNIRNKQLFLRHFTDSIMDSLQRHLQSHSKYGSDPFIYGTSQMTRNNCNKELFLCLHFNKLLSELSPVSDSFTDSSQPTQKDEN